LYKLFLEVVILEYACRIFLFCYIYIIEALSYLLCKNRNWGKAKGGAR